jgi:hypothetical protein
LIESLTQRALLILIFSTFGALAFAQMKAPGTGPRAAPLDLHQLAKQLPKGAKPYDKHGELLEVRLPGSQPEIGRLYASVDPYAVLAMPTGEFKIIHRSVTKPTTSPFVPAKPDDIIESLKKTEFGKYKVEKGQFYIYFYDCSEGFFMHAKSILESMLNGVVQDIKGFGLKVKKPEFPLVVIIMPNRKAYDAFHEMPKEMVAYYDQISNRIIMYEDEELWEAAPEFAAKRAAYTVAHENVHQLLANTGVQGRLAMWPQWIQEGIAEYYCPLKVNSSLVRKDKSEIPTRTMKWSKAGMVNDDRMYSLLKTQPSNGAAVKSLVSAAKIDANGYALAWGLVHYLINKKPEEFRAYLADLTKYEPLDPAHEIVGGTPDPLFVKHFGEDFPTLEHDLQLYLTSKKMQSEYVDPVENQTMYIVKSVEKKGKVFENRTVITTSPAAVKKFKDEIQAEHPGATINTTICKNKAEVERQKKLMK